MVEFPLGKYGCIKCGHLQHEKSSLCPKCGWELLERYSITLPDGRKMVSMRHVADD